jgi:hypothetical protein
MVYHARQSEDASHQPIEAWAVRERRRTRSTVSIRQRQVERDSTMNRANECVLVDSPLLRHDKKDQQGKDVVSEMKTA